MNQGLVKIINNYTSKKIFKYKGKLIAGIPNDSDIDYKFKIIGEKKMMSVGEYYDYALLSVTIVSLNDSLSKLVFTPKDDETSQTIAKSFEKNLYYFYNNLNYEIQDFLINFGFDNRTTIHEFNFDLNKQEKLEESSMSRMSKIAVRTTVKDILKILKDNKSGEFTLPVSQTGEEYSFTNLPFGYSVDLFIFHDTELDGFSVDGSFSSEDDVIEIGIKYNPKNFKKYIYDIVGELNDIVAHELEHAFQFIKEGKIHKKKPSKSLLYYTQPDEIKAQRVGLRRLANLKKLPYVTVVKEWFDTHTDVHGLKEHEMNKVIKKILNDN
jgi:hypothetical protein